MSLPDPQPGLVIRYAYLWRSEADQGREEGSKDRPCAIVLTAKREEGSVTVVVAPITHTPPRNPKVAIEIPAAVKARLHLDHERSWIVTDDLNFFTWPGPDIRPTNVTPSSDGFSYGYLPRALTKSMIDMVVAQLQARSVRPVRRDEQ